MSETSILSNPIVSEPSDKAQLIEANFEKELNTLVTDPINLNELSALSVVLMPNYVEIETHKGVKKCISYSSFKELIDKTLRDSNVEPVVIQGMLLPSNVFFINQTSDHLRFNCYYVEGVKDLLYNDKKLKTVSPNIIISYVLRKEGTDWIIHSVRYFCTDLSISKLPKTFIDEVDHSKGIYDLPLSNTYGGGAMCYGSNTMPARFKDSNFRGLDWYYKYLWETPFNNDLGIRAIGNCMGVYEWYVHMDKLAKDNSRYPYNKLVGWTNIAGTALVAESN